MNRDNSDRKNALLGVSAGLSAAQGVQDLRLAGATDTNPNQAGVQSDYGSTIGINASFGSQSSRSEQTIHQVNHDGSVFDAGGNINLTATEKDIRIENGTLDAGNNINLDAARDVLLLAKQDTTELSGKNESNGWSIGGSLDLSGGWGLNASVNKGRGSESGNTIINQSTVLNADNQVTITSGRDTQIIGSQVKGDGIVLNVGNNLRIESLQDSDVYHSSQTNMGLSLSGGLGMIGGGINADRTKMDSNYASVNDQAGLFAGQKGLDVDVVNNTHMKGGAMTSEGENNSLSTGTLTFEDIQNKADFTVSGNSAGLNVGNGGLSLPTVSNSNHNGSAENTTKATVGNNIDITIRDEANQTQDIATLNRDTNNAHNRLDNIFDKDKEQSRLDEQKLIADIGNQLSTIVRTEGQIRAEQAKNDPQALKQAEQELRLEGKTPTEEDIKQRAENNAMKDWGTGGKYQQITQAVTGALKGLLGGDLTQALANGSAPFLAEAIKNATTNPDGSVNKEANLAAHAILGALLSQANGNSALAGGLAALTAEAAAQLIKDQLYGNKSFADLTEAERQNISALAQIAAAVAGGLAGDSTSDAAQGALAGKNAVENNNLGNDFNFFNINPDYIDGVGSLILHLQSQGASPEEIALALENYGKIAGKPREEALLELASLILDFTPIVGDAKGYYEAESTIDYLIATLGLIPGAGDAAGKLLKEAKTLAKNGDYAGANKLINEANTEIKNLNSGSKGNWNKDLNNPKPNTVYNVDGVKTYKTDEFGRVNSVEADLTLLTKDRNTYQQCKAGKCGDIGDDGGHLIASIFGGPGEALNLTPMASTLNRQDWKAMENSWAKALKEGKNVKVNIQPIYSGTGVRADTFNVSYWIDGKLFTRKFNNE